MVFAFSSSKLQTTLGFDASPPFQHLKEKEKKETLEMIRAHGHAIRAANLFQKAGKKLHGTPKAPPSPVPTGDYSVSLEQLTSMTKEQDLSDLQNFGGVKGLAEKLKTDPDKGIIDDESNILDRKDVFGSNTYPQKKGPSFWRFLHDACQDDILITLMVLAAISMALGIKREGIKEGWVDGGSIAFAVIIVMVITAISDYMQSLQFHNLNEEKQNIQMEVVRSGRRMKISIFDIVVGDVIPLKIGDRVPADGVLISGHCLFIDESNMSGESNVHIDHKSPFLMSGCKVADGFGTMLATSVGINTEWGFLMASISEDNGKKTPLQLSLTRVGVSISLPGCVAALFVLIILLIRFRTGHTEDDEGKVEYIAGKTSFLDEVDVIIKTFIIAVVMFVVAVSDMFSLAVTLMLAYSMRRMMADKALVRRLSACEKMGSATTICTGKTGTLTLNMMTVIEAYICGKKIDPPNNTSELPSRVVSLLIESVAQNTTGSVFLPEGGRDVEVFGSPTEKALLGWAIKLGMNFDAVRSESSIIHAFPFNSEKKQGGVAVKRPDSEVHVHWKGAAEFVLAACTRYMDSDLQLAPLNEGKVKYLKKAIDNMAARGLRCIAIAYRPCEPETVPTDEDDLAHWDLPESNLVLLAIVGLKDPCRPGVRDAVQLCTNAGVKVRMVTGDNLQTARAIALECGILGSADVKDPNVIEGKAFRALSEEQRLEVAERIFVMGRSSPNDKLLLVQALRRRGHVVAVTGFGTNDAPALHEADIGLAMGIQGTQVAKESSDIIILDDNFASIVKVVQWGRSVYANIQKFIQFWITIYAASLTINIVPMVFSVNFPLNAVQLLWVNLIMDTLGALALATELPNDHLMDRHPVGSREPIVTNIIWRNSLIQAFYQVTVLLVINFHGKQLLHSQHDPIKEKNTLIFNACVFAQIFNAFNARKPDEMNVFKGVTKNRLFLGIVGLTVAFQVVIIMFLGKFISTLRLSWQLWLVSIGIGFISWPLAAIGKLIPVSPSMDCLPISSHPVGRGV